MVTWLNKHKTKIQILAVLLGLAMLYPPLSQAFTQGGPAALAQQAEQAEQTRPAQRAQQPQPAQQAPQAKQPRPMREHFFDPFKGMANGLSKPAEIGIYALVALYAVRMLIKMQQKATDVTRTLLRFLQIIHIPLACVVLAAALLHGGMYVLYLWRSDFHYWSGVAALITMVGVSLLGLLTVKSRKNKYAHMVTGLTVFGIVLIHIFTA